jgi:hypothetical protein
MLNAQALHHTYVFLVLVVEIVSDISVIIIVNISRSLAEVIPDTWPASVFVGSALNLVSGGGHSPGEVSREVAHSARCEVIGIVID